MNLPTDTREKSRMLGEAMEWISVEERLPSAFEIVLFTSAKWPEDGVDTGWLTPEGEWINGLWRCARDFRQIPEIDITHWMPLPNPPEATP